MEPEEILPAEVWEMIAKNLSIKDCLNLSLASYHMNRILSENPTIWSQANLSKELIRQEGIMKVFQTKFRMFKRLNLSFCRPDDCTSLFRHVLAASPLYIEQIAFADFDDKFVFYDFCYDDFIAANLSQVPPTLLGQALARIKKINMEKAKLSTEQWSELFSTISTSSPTSVEDVDLFEADLTKIPHVPLCLLYTSDAADE